MLGPVVVVAEQLGVQARTLQRRAERVDELGLLGDRQVHAGVAVRVPVLRLVLQRDRVDRHARALIGLDELHEVQRVRVVDARVVDQPAADQRRGRLHPRGRAPRRGDDLQVRVERSRLAQQRDDLREIVVDGEVAHAVVGAPGGQVVVGVERPVDEIRGAHRLAQHVEPVGAEQVAHCGGALLRVEPVQDAR